MYFSKIILLEEYYKKYKVKSILLIVVMISILSLYLYIKSNKLEYSEEIGKVSLYVELI